MNLLLALVVVIAAMTVTLAAKAKKVVEKKVDPKACEVCVSNLEKIDMLIPKEKKSDKLAIEKAINTHCTLSGFGSEWKPNPNLESPKDVKMCYMFEPIKKSISTPFSMGMPKKKVCERLKKDNPEVCEVKYPIKVEKKAGEEVDYSKMKVKELKTILDQRGAKCHGCSEKSDFVKKCQETEHLDL
ncbi:degradation arginine-rich protein for mis-folding-domain-containing protein [Ochromonadaceae sp. CCMP2298]|nr:degradation arginine-rich protein for mis-folding-domain-containing protein [Ochromonadaceae sp. CCMP2298]|mmetsp:Transcript_23024/g.51180  ORF Transcript_23024/g.51180 Transcript_23024/m.51180 type:complete len:186 (-) Transcript_23024:102-659(-)